MLELTPQIVSPDQCQSSSRFIEYPSGFWSCLEISFEKAGNIKIQIIFQENSFKKAGH
jgi:hypothetical protein